MQQELNLDTTKFTLNLVIEHLDSQLLEKIDTKDVEAIKEIVNLIDDVEDLLRAFDKKYSK